MKRHLTLLALSILMVTGFFFTAPVYGAQEKSSSGEKKGTSSPQVVAVVSGDTFDTRKNIITHKTSSFTPSSRVIHVSVGITGLEKGMDITGIIRAISVKDKDGKVYRNTNIASTTLKSPGSKATAHFHFSAPKEGWPVGAYSVGVFVAGNIIYAVNLEVKQ